MSDPMPEIKSKHSLVAKYVTQPLWEKLSRAVTKVDASRLCLSLSLFLYLSVPPLSISLSIYLSHKIV